MAGFLEELAYGLKQAAKKPTILNYVPNSKVHEDFHKSQTVGRLLRGGNRSGKSVAGAVESIWRATGRHPYYKTHDVPTRGRIVTVDREAGINQIILPLMKQWIPPSELKNGSWEDSWSRQDKLLTLRNGSTVEMKTHQQEIDSFAGVPLHYIWFDEECPKAIFDECRLRLIDYNGVWYMTMTPVEGQDWIFDRFIVTNSKNIEKFEVNIRDNPHLNQEALALLSEDLTDEEKDVREKGIFVPRGGLVLKEFEYDRHIISSKKDVPKNWGIYVSIDHGFNNPTAILWHAVSPNLDVITFKEHYMRKWVIKKHADRIREINAELGVEPLMYIGDPSMSQRTAETGSSPLQIYKENGIPVVQAKRDVGGGIDKMNEYFKYNKWYITQDCPSTIKEIRGYSFKIYNSPKIADRNNVIEQPNKKNDHACDSARYFFSFMPRIAPEHKMKAKTVSSTITNQQDFPWDIDQQLYIGSSDESYEQSFGEV